MEKRKENRKFLQIILQVFMPKYTNNINIIHINTTIGTWNGKELERVSKTRKRNYKNFG